MGAQWLNACGQVDAETTGARWAAVHGCPWPTAAEIGSVFLRKIMVQNGTKATKC